MLPEFEVGGGLGFIKRLSLLCVAKRRNVRHLTSILTAKYLLTFVMIKLEAKGCVKLRVYYRKVLPLI